MMLKQSELDFEFDQDITLNGIPGKSNILKTIAQMSIENAHKLAEKCGVGPKVYNPEYLIQYPLFFMMGAELGLPSPTMVKYELDTSLFVFFYKLNVAYVIAPYIDMN